MSGVLDTLTKRRDAHHPDSAWQVLTGCDVCLACKLYWPCPDAVALDAAIASLNKTIQHLEAIRDRETSNWNFTSERGVSKCPCYEDSRANIWDAVAALALLAPNHNNTQD